MQRKTPFDIQPYLKKPPKPPHWDSSNTSTWLTTQIWLKLHMLPLGTHGYAVAFLLVLSLAMYALPGRGAAFVTESARYQVRFLFTVHVIATELGGLR